MSNKKMIGITLATAAVLAFAAAPVTSALAKGQVNSVKCYGNNSCKGMSECKTANNSCKGLNNCKGQGLTLAASQKTCEESGGSATQA
jgi:uncharacterized membrane protein